MFLAVLVDGDGSVYLRHDGEGSRRSDSPAGLSGATEWHTARGQPAAPGRFDLFAPPPEGLLLTSFTSTGRVFTSRAEALSLKGVVRGRETFELDRGLKEVRQGAFLAVNEGHEYTSIIEPGEPVETFCVAFGRNLAAEVARDLNSRRPRPTESPFEDAPASLELLEAVLPGPGELVCAAENLRRTMGGLDGEALQERAVALLARLLKAQDRVRQEAEALEGLRRTDRLEVYRRLLRARDSMEATLGQAGSLEKWAAQADMSRFHFARAFKAAFGMSPHRYRMTRRLERARELLMRSRRTTTDIALEVGFDNPSHFAAAYRRRFGETPGHARQAN
jgi:AraC-like DNA-binding protein